jgi:DNA-binding XRE family transcriptional regulator
MKSRQHPGKLVAQLRHIIGKSQSQFATMVGASKHSIISLENGRIKKLTRNLAKRIEIATGADLSQGKIGSPFSHDNYARADFYRWREEFNPSNQDSALQKFNEMNTCLKVIFLAAAKSGRAGNRDRLPALYLSLAEWLEDAREKFKLQDEIEAILEDQTRQMGRSAYSISSLLEEPAKSQETLAEHGIDFNKIKKELKKHEFGGWLIVDDEHRSVWCPGHSPFTVLCNSRKLIPKAKYWIETIKHDPASLQELLQELKKTPLSSKAIKLINAPMNQMSETLKRVESDYRIPLMADD